MFRSKALDFSHNHCVAQKTVNNTIVKPLNNCIALLASRVSDPSHFFERNFDVSKVSWSTSYGSSSVYKPLVNVPAFPSTELLMVLKR